MVFGTFRFQFRLQFNWVHFAANYGNCFIHSTHSSHSIDDLLVLLQIARTGYFPSIFNNNRYKKSSRNKKHETVEWKKVRPNIQSEPVRIKNKNPTEISTLRNYFFGQIEINSGIFLIYCNQLKLNCNRRQTCSNSQQKHMTKSLFWVIFELFAIFELFPISIICIIYLF